MWLIRLPEVFPPAFTSSQAHVIPAIANAIWTENGEFIFDSVVIAIQAMLVVVAHWRSSVNEPVLWRLSLWGLAHEVSGLVPVPKSWPMTSAGLLGAITAAIRWRLKSHTSNREPPGLAPVACESLYDPMFSEELK